MAQKKILSTSFNKAYLNSFKPRNDESADLRTEYYVATEVKIRDSETTRSLPAIRNPEFDFKC